MHEVEAKKDSILPVSSHFPSRRRWRRTRIIVQEEVHVSTRAATSPPYFQNLARSFGNRVDPVNGWQSTITIVPLTAMIPVGEEPALANAPIILAENLASISGIGSPNLALAKCCWVGRSKRSVPFMLCSPAPGSSTWPTSSIATLASESVPENIDDLKCQVMNSLVEKAWLETAPTDIVVGCLRPPRPRLGTYRDLPWNMTKNQRSIKFGNSAVVQTYDKQSVENIKSNNRLCSLKHT